MADLRVGQSRMRDEEQAASMRPVARQVMVRDSRARVGRKKLIHVARIAEDGDLAEPRGFQRADIIDHHRTAGVVQRFRPDVPGDVT